MPMIYALLVVALPGAVIVFLTWRLTKAREALVAARRQAAHAQARRDSARRAAQVAEKRCTQVLGQMETALAQTGAALEIAGTIELVSQQLRGLIDYIASPDDAPPPLQHEPGRHALPGPGRHALPGSDPYDRGDAFDSSEFDSEPQEEYLP
jgi:hypothetical protein